MAVRTTTSFIRPETFWRELGVRGNQTIAHLGCGAGFFLIPAAKIVGPKGRAIGLDVRADMLEETEGRARRENVAEIVETILVNLEEGPTAHVNDNVTDWTLVANILYQADPLTILAEADRITKPNGTIVIVEWDIVSTPLGPPNEERLSPDELREILVKLNLEIIKSFDPSPYHYGFLVKAKKI